MPRNHQYALIESKGVFLNTEFGRTYALTIFELKDHELEAIVGRYTKGKWQGELRGKITWIKCLEGGWFKLDGFNFVSIKTGDHQHLIVDPWTYVHSRPKVLWSEEFKHNGWLPGETQGQYDTRQKAKHEGKQEV